MYLQINVARLDVEFHSMDHSLVAEPSQTPSHAKWAKLGEKNPNDVFNSKRVVVVGNHVLKGYEGTVKSTTPDGYAFVELDSRIQQTYKVNLYDLAFQ